MGPSGKCVSGFHRTSPSLPSSGQPPVCVGGTLLVGLENDWIVLTF